MIRSSKHSLKFCNTNKKKEISTFLKQYKEMLDKYVNILWNEFQTNPQKMLSSKYCNKIATNIKCDSRLRQCAAKQACAIVNGTMRERNKQLFILKKLQKENKDTKFLQRKIDIISLTKPKIGNISAELDQRFLDIKKINGHFNYFIKINSIGNKREIFIPIKATKMSNKWETQGKLKNSIRLNENYIVLFFEIPEPIKKSEGKIVGADQGIITTLSLSDGQITKKNKDNYDLNKICEIISRRKKGSKRFQEAQEHRKNYINWSINQLNFKNIKEIRLEKVQNIRKGKRNNRFMQGWTYVIIKNKLVSLSNTEGFSILEVDNKFRSQRCSKCGYVHKSNRKGKTFICKNTNCSFTADSDMNAASNLEIDLYDINISKVWQDRLNRSSGFYWNIDGIYLDKEYIVPYTKKE